MSLETIVLAVAWAVGLIVVVAVIAPALMSRMMPGKANDRELLFEDDFYDLDGPVIDAEPA